MMFYHVLSCSMMFYDVLCLKSNLGFLLSERTSRVSPVIFHFGAPPYWGWSYADILKMKIALKMAEKDWNTPLFLSRCANQRKDFLHFGQQSTHTHSHHFEKVLTGLSETNQITLSKVETHYLHHHTSYI